MALLEPQGFPGLTALVVGSNDDAAIAFAGGLILRYAKASEIDGVDDVSDSPEDDRDARFAKVRTPDATATRQLGRHAAALEARTL